MKEKFLIEDYENPPVAKTTEARQGDTYVSSIAWHDGQPVGYTVSIDYWTPKYGKETYLEDLYIKESYRRKGAGSILLSSVWSEAKKRGSNGLYWVCLGWNEKSLKFYHALGAEDQDSTFYRFENDA